MPEDLGAEMVADEPSSDLAEHSLRPRAEAPPPPPPPLPENADATAWLAVAAGNIGALMATLDISIVNSSLPTIQGEIGASGTEGTWIATAYLVAEIVIIPLAGWLERLFGLRTFLVTAASLFTVFSLVCGLAHDLPMMIIGRVGQGLTGGAMIPTAQTIIATRLPRHQQPVGIAFFGATAVLGPVFGPLLGGWLTENLSWHWAFFLNVPVCAGLLSLLLLSLPREKPRFELLAEADYLGIAGLILGFGAATIVLEEGQREQWFSSPTISWLTAVAVLGMGLLLAGQRLAKRPVIRMRLLLDRQFASVVGMVTVVGVVVYGSAYVIPQFLSTIAGYNAFQSGGIVFLSGVPAMILIVFAPRLLRSLDIRIAVLVGMGLLALSAAQNTNLTPDSAGGEFVVSQLLRGTGMILTLLFLNQAAIQSVAKAYASDAAGLYNTARNLGGSLALAGISVIQDQRLWFHSTRLRENIAANAPATYLDALAQRLGSHEAALQSFSNAIDSQALVLTYIDLFWLVAIGVVCVSPLIVFLRPLQPGRVVEGGH